MINYWLTKGHKVEALFGFPPLKDILDKERDIVKMTNEMPRDEIVDKIATCYTNFWAPTNNLRTMTWLEIYKAKFGLSDEELVEKLNSDLELMYFCWFDYAVKTDIHPTSLTKFRNKLREWKVLEELQAIAVKPIIRKLPKRIINSVDSDTTCFEENIQFPTDAWLLQKVVKKVTWWIEKSRKRWNKVLIRWKHTFNKICKVFNVQRKKKTEQINDMKKLCLERWFKLVSDLKDFYKSKRTYIKSLWNRTYKEIGNFIQIAWKILDQQKEMMDKEVKKIWWRIVSLHKHQIRPIFRWKMKQATEFGQKMLVNLIWWKLMTVVSLKKENESDTKVVKRSIEHHKSLTWAYPNEYWFDKWWHSPWNHKLLKRLWIKDWIQCRWKIPDEIKNQKWQKRLYSKRTIVEAKIGIGKRRYWRWKNIFSIWNGLNRAIFGAIAMNYSRYVKTI